jgi:23S rRNA-/tRNA-specific pseudouridylate synthase
MHQVRAHLAFEGLPVIGDSVYGNKRINGKYRADHIALWLKSIVFEIGTSHEYSYLNGKAFESSNHSFPKCAYDAGLLETD